MANPEHLARLKEGVQVWNEWRENDNTTVPDLSAADLSLGDFSEANLAWVNLCGANLSGSKLYNANFRDAVLNRANFYDTDVSWANLAGVGLCRADLRLANLTGANLIGADLSGARVNETVFGDTDLRNVQGLDTCEHSGPSTLDHRTLAKSGRLPLTFLRGCGLPDKLIDYVPSLLEEAIQFYSCFISYSTKDQDFAERLYADLQNNGVRCWFAPHNVQGGKKLHEQIDEAIRVYDRLLLLLSEHSMNSEWVKTEISKARKREARDKRRMLFPLRLVQFAKLQEWECFDADAGKDSAQEIREYYVPDFSNWKSHDSYQEEFRKLVRDLKT